MAEGRTAVRTQGMDDMTCGAEMKQFVRLQEKLRFGVVACY